ncbi:MAG: T9SS type A sorting domain-containing protein [Anaerolineae bacterium]|nr:T9SS type A sorting domain-containing protein [Anaerolineae bacterium]
MRKQLLFTVLTFILPLSVVWGQESQVNYFPLEVGNTWTYFTPLDPPFAEPDTIWDRSAGVSDVITANDTLYFRVNYPFAPADTLRSDAEGRIWARMQDQDVLLFDFTRDHGDVYTFGRPGDTLITFKVTVQRNQSIEVHAGRFENGIIISFDDPAWVDDVFSFAFAPGVGIVYAYGEGGWYEELYSAQVAGRIITAIDEVPFVVPGAKAFAYPNPFRTATSIVVPSMSVQPAEASVYDVVGRKVSTLGAVACHTDACRFELDGSGLAPGLYYVRIDQAGRVQTLAVMLVR